MQRLLAGAGAQTLLSKQLLGTRLHPPPPPDNPDAPQKRPRPRLARYLAPPPSPHLSSHLGFLTQCGLSESLTPVLGGVPYADAAEDADVGMTIACLHPEADFNLREFLMEVSPLGTSTSSS
jgi:hypothetical protein